MDPFPLEVEVSSFANMIFAPASPVEEEIAFLENCSNVAFRRKLEVIQLFEIEATI